MSTYMKLALALVLFAAGLAAGYTWEHRALEAANAKNAAQIAAMESDAAKRVAAADARAAKEEQDMQAKIAVDAVNYEKEKSDAQVKSNAAVARALAGTDRLRVALAIAAHSIAVSGTPPNSSGVDPTCSDTLRPDVAARLIERYAERNDIARRLNLAEDALAAERAAEVAR